MDLPHLRRPLEPAGVERALPRGPRARPDRPVDRVRSADPVRLQLRRADRAARGRQGRRADQLARRLPRAVRGHPARAHEHVDDDQRHRDVAAGALRRAGPRARRGAGDAARHDPERHRQGVPGPRHVHLPARALAADDRRDLRVLRRAPARVEPVERVQLSPAGGRRDAGAGGRLRAGDRGRAARSHQGPRPHRRRGVRALRRPAVVLRQQRHPLRRGDVQDARVRGAVGGAHARSLRHHRPEAAALSLRRAGQLARPHRGAAREQRVAHLDRGAGRDLVAQRAVPRAAAAGVERGDVVAAAVGSAVGAAAAADPRLRDRPARVSRSVRGQPGGRRQDRRDRRRRQGRARAHPRDGRRAGRGRRRLHEAGAGALDDRAHDAHRRRPAGGGRAQPLERQPAVAAHHRR